MHEDDGFEEEFVDGVVGAEEGGFGGGEERVPCLREERVSKGVEGGLERSIWWCCRDSKYCDGWGGLAANSSHVRSSLYLHCRR